jgi:glutamate-1-semialdehyde aminotransferase
VPEADVLDMRFNVGAEGRVWYTTEPTSKGIPKVLTQTVIIVPFNDCGRGEQAFADNPGEIAAVILEPVMMNIGLVVPQPGYLQALRDICERNGAALIYDEVKCGGTIAYGGTTERYGVRPHLAAYAKAIGGGVTIGAFGGEARSWNGSPRARRSRARSTGTRSRPRRASRPSRRS